MPLGEFIPPVLAPAAPEPVDPIPGVPMPWGWLLPMVDPVPIVPAVPLDMPVPEFMPAEPLCV
jgi:hypothetical protein